MATHPCKLIYVCLPAPAGWSIHDCPPLKADLYIHGCPPLQADLSMAAHPCRLIYPWLHTHVGWFIHGSPPLQADLSIHGCSPLHAAIEHVICYQHCTLVRSGRRNNWSCCWHVGWSRVHSLHVLKAATWTPRYQHVTVTQPNIHLHTLTAANYSALS